MQLSDATIFALATPPGKSGVAVVRVSGRHAADTLAALGGHGLPPPRLATLLTLRTAEGQMIDKALVLSFPAPHSFTGEHVLEYHLHGSRAVIAAVLNLFAALPGLRPAEPGEFARRAFYNGKMDLTAAEGLADLIDAETESQRRQAMALVQGEAAGFYHALRAGIVHALAFLEAYIDFPDEDIPTGVLEQIEAEIAPLAARMKHELEAPPAAEKLREGVRVAIVGPPNAGKSSLINLLARRELAIVSPVAGTTRDVLEAHLELAGFSVTLVDTAGIRESDDLIESEGIRRSLSQAGQADIRLIVLDASAYMQPSPPDETLLAPLMDDNALIVYNKIDIADRFQLPFTTMERAVCVSAQQGQGIDLLIQMLEQKIGAIYPPQSVLLTRTRHRLHLGAALGHIQRYLAHPELPLELRCEELRSAALEIGKITGIIAVDELLGHIFSSFCIGK